MQASTPWNDVAFSFSERDRHLGIRPVSQLNAWPVVSPVNASRRPSRDAAHHSGSGRLATPYPVKDLHLLFFASLSWRTPSRVDTVEKVSAKEMWNWILKQTNPGKWILNQDCALAADLESTLLRDSCKFFFRQYRSCVDGAHGSRDFLAFACGRVQ